MNLFQSILDKAKSGFDYIASGQPGANLYDATHNVDPTQTIQFKAVQGGADLFTGIKNRLQETYQEDISAKQKKADEEGIAFAQHLASQGYNQQQIFSALDSLKSEGKLSVTPNFSERLVSGLANRMGEMQQTTERLSSTPIAKRLVTGTTSYGGDVVGTAFEPVTAAVSPLIQKGIKATGQEENIAKLGAEWEKIRQQYPNFADFAEGTANISSLLPIPKAGGLIKQGGVKTLQTAEKLTPNFSAQSKKLISQADMGFRKQAEDIALPKLSQMGMREKQKVVGDVIETKPGLFKKEELVRNPQEALAIEEVSRMLKEGKIKTGGTELQKSTAISNEINGLAEALKGRLENTPNPVTIPKSEVESFIDNLAANIDKNPIMVGDLKQSANIIIKNLKEKLTKSDYTPNDLLEIRKQLDNDIQTFKGDTVFDPKIENAFSTTLREFRQGLNNKVAELVPDANVRNFLDRQSALYIAKDNVDLKWSKQANTTIGRMLTKIQSVTGIPRTEIIELTTALGLLGASSLTPIVAPIAAGATAIVGGKKALGTILSPKNKVRLSKVLTKLDEAIKKNPKDSELVKAKKLLTNPPKNGGISPNIRNSSNNGGNNTQSLTPTKFNTLGQKKKVITPQSPVAYELGSMGKMKPIQPKQLFAGENSAQPPKSKTGWFKGADGKMRFEIDDSGAKFYDNAKVNKSGKALLGDIFRHDELFNQYPETKSIIVKFNDTVEKGGGNYNPSTRTLTINGLELDPRTGEFLGGTKEAKSTLLHEIQHAIQNKEGFARGGNMEMFTSDKNLQKLNTELSELMSDKSKMSAIELKEAYGTKGVDHYINKIKDELSKFDETGRHGLYRRLGGEVEARNVQSRMNLTAKERTIKKPESTEDVPRPKQIIRMDSKGPMQSRGYTTAIKKPIVKRASDASMETKKLIEEAKKYKSAEEFFKKNTSTPIDGFKTNIENFFGKNNKIRFGNDSDPNWRKLEYYKKAVNYWKDRIQKGERPKISVSVDEDGIKPFRVYDGNHRLQAYKELYKELGITEIPLAQYSPIKLVKESVENLYK